MDNKQNVLLGVIVILFGFIFLVSPQSVFSTIVVFAGIVCISFGLLRILATMKEDSNYNKTYSFFSAILSIAFGIILIVYRQKTIMVVAEVLGVCLLISGISSLQLMLKNNMKGNVLVKPISKIIIGSVSLFVPMAPAVVAGTIIGIILILAGLSIITTKKEEEVVYKVKIKK